MFGSQKARDESRSLRTSRNWPEETAATKSSEDATQVNAPDHEDEVQATTPITASRITEYGSNENHCEGTTLYSKC